MRKKVILITGASGEIGRALVETLSQLENTTILTLDIQSLPEDITPLVTHIQGSITDKALLDRLVSEYEIDVIPHLAALLSTRAEFTPEAAHQVNVEGTLLLLQLAAEQSQGASMAYHGTMLLPAPVYGMPNLDTKAKYARVREWEWNYPTTMYGCNKLYCELLGTYYSQYYKQLAATRPVTLDFRAIRFPGLVSAFTMPSGGTSDYGPEMLHAAAQGQPYDCFVRPDTTIPFMAMPDAVKALLDLSAAPAENLKRRVYNTTSFCLSADDFRNQVLKAFPGAQVIFQPDLKRQTIVDSWPMDVDDSFARQEWGWQPEYTLERCFEEYLLPNIRQRYTG